MTKPTVEHIGSSTRQGITREEAFKVLEDMHATKPAPGQIIQELCECLQDICDHWDWWMEDTHDREGLGDHIPEARELLARVRGETQASE